jgi:hypothetical protein
VASASDAAGEDEDDAAGLQRELGVLAVTLLGAAVGEERHAERGRVVVGGLAGVAHVVADVVPALDREGVLADVVLDGADQLGVGPTAGAVGGVDHGGLLGVKTRSRLANAAGDAVALIMVHILRLGKQCIPACATCAEVTVEGLLHWTI